MNTKPIKLRTLIMAFLLFSAVISLTLQANSQTLQRVIPTTSAYARRLLMLETVQDWDNLLTIGSNGVSGGLGSLTNLPLYTSLQGNYRLPFANTNNGSNGTITYQNLEAQLNAEINPSFPWLIITNGSSSSVIQDAFNSLTNGGVVSFQPGTNYPDMASQILITNSMNVYGNGVALKYAAGKTNFMMDTTTNYGKTLLIDNLVFNGGVVSTYNDSSHHFGSGGVWEPFYNQCWTNRSGLRVEASGGVRIQNCTFANWPGNGCLACQEGGSFTSQTTPKFEFLFNRCYTNFVGVFVASASYEIPGYYNSDPSLWRGGYGAEYAVVMGNDCFENQMGIVATAGNALVQGNTVDANFFGIAGFAGENSQHGNWTGNIANHNQVAAYSESTASSGTSMIQDNVFLANVAVAFNGARGVIFKNNWIGKASLNFTNGTSGSCEMNKFDYNAVWGVDFTNTFSGNIMVQGNMSVDGTNTDGSILSLSMVHGAYSDNTNYVSSRFAPPITAGTFKYVPSNGWMWAVSGNFTNRLFQVSQ